MDIEDLINIEFHDLPVEALCLDFVANNLKIQVACHNDATEEYNSKAICFSDVANLSIEGEFISTKANGKEINWSNLQTCDRYYRIEIIFLQGSTSPSVKVAFDFSSVKLDD